jgi:oligopeptide transport system substrate-binding protein
MSILNRWTILLAIFLAAWLVIAPACGGDDDDDGDNGGDDTPSAQQTVPAGSGEYEFVLTEAPDDAAPPEEQEITVNLRGEPDTIDPQKTSFSDSITVERLIFAGLITFDDDLNLVPVIATEVPTQENGGISADGLTYTFKLRTDAKWTDGQTVTANDFEYGIKRLFNPTLGAYYASLYTDIVGAAESLEATDPTEEQIATAAEAIGVNAIDDTTLEIKLSQPVATFAQRMALHGVLPVREDIVTANPDDWTEPDNIVSNGPYRLTEWAHEDHFTLEANPDFFLGAPVLKKITMIMQPDTNVALAAYDAGELDTSQVPPAAVNDVRGRAADELQEGNTLVTFAVMMNNARPPFDDVNVRKALASALDRDAYVTAIHQGIGVPAITWMPEGIPGHDPEVGIAFDAEQARQYLADSEKYPNGEGIPTLTFMAADDTTNQLIAEYVKAQLDEVLGLNVEIEILESSAYEGRFNNNEYQMAYSGWGADYPDPDNWIPAHFHSEASLNHYEYVNAEVDRLIEEAAAELDNEARIQLYQDAQRIILVDDAAIAPLEVDAVFHLVKPYVEGFRRHPLDAQIVGDYSYARMYVSD